MNELIKRTGSMTDHYMSIPSLEAEEEKALAIDYFDNNNIESAKKIVLSYMKYVVSIANSYKGYGLDREELIQEGTVGLMKSIKKFNPYMDNKISTYATDWIKSSIMDYVIKNMNPVKLVTTKAHRKIFFNINKYRDERGYLDTEAKQRMASDLSLTVEQIEEAMSRFSSKMYSYSSNDPDEDGYEDGVEFHIESPAPSPDSIVIDGEYEVYQEESLHNAIASLNDREKDIIKNRWLTESPCTLSDLSEKYSVSAERVRQLEKQAMSRIKKHLSENSEFV